MHALGANNGTEILMLHAVGIKRILPDEQPTARQRHFGEKSKMLKIGDALKSQVKTRSLFQRATPKNQHHPRHKLQ